MARRAADGAAPPGAWRGTVLIVGADPAWRVLLGARLEDDGYQVLEAADIATMLDRQSERYAAVVVINPRLSGIDGFHGVGGFGLLQARHRPTAVLLGAGRLAFDADAARDELETLLEQVERACRRHRLRDHAHIRARADALTGLPNRDEFKRHLGQFIDESVSTARNCALVCIDLDGFRLLNDTQGSMAGELLLRAVTDRLIETVPDAAAVARVGDDEFMVVMPGCGQEPSAQRLAARLREALARPMTVSGREVGVPAGIGISLFPRDGADAAALIRAADTALHRAKQGGRIRTCLYDAEMGAELQARMSVELGLREALAGDQLGLHYQPLVDLRDGSLRSLEVLVRWHDPVIGQVPPEQFIPVAEDTGIIHRLGGWVLESACAQTRRWCAGPANDFRIAVNVSGVQFEAPDFVTGLRDILKRVGLPPGRLELELTENVVMRDVERSVAMMAELKQLGIHISVDNFGTGYSSLALLRRLPLDTLKIDRSFVGNLPHAEDDCSIVRAIVAMAQSLRLEVVAEGVENWQQLEFLRGVGVETGQGYYVGRPADAQSAGALVAAGRIPLQPPPGVAAERPVVLGKKGVFRV